jgi:DnaJ-class molecular chaperone
MNEDISEKKYLICHDCDGRGYRRNDEGHSYTCPTCKGKGDIKIEEKKKEPPK